MAQDQVRLRFFGRFMYVKSYRTKTIKVLAPRFPSGGSDEHFPLMTIRRDRLKFQENDDSPVLTTLPPAFKVMSDADALVAELWVWNLRGLQVSYNVTSAVTLTTVTSAETVTLEPQLKTESGQGVVAKTELLAYPEIEKHAGNDPPELDPDALRAHPSRRSHAVIEISGGDGKARRIDSTVGPYKFAKYGNLAKPIKDDGGKDIEKNLADLVEFDVTVDSKKIFTMTFTDQNGKIAGTVAVKNDTSVGLSHVCSRIHGITETQDLEFLEFYNLLKDKPQTGNRVVPLEPPGAGLIEGPDCAVSVTIDQD